MISTVAAKVAHELAGLRYRRAQVEVQISSAPNSLSYRELDAARRILDQEIEGWELLYSVALGDVDVRTRPQYEFGKDMYTDTNADTPTYDSGDSRAFRRLAEKAGLVKADTEPPKEHPQH